MRILFTGSNADAEGQALNVAIGRYVGAHAERADFVSSLGKEGYLAAVRNAAVVVGNWSSALIEVPALGVPSVDIGNRRSHPPHQRRTCRARCGRDSSSNPEGRVREVRGQAAAAVNPYGDGHAAQRIVDVLAAAVANLIEQGVYDVSLREAP